MVEAKSGEKMERSEAGGGMPGAGVGTAALLLLQSVSGGISPFSSRGWLCLTGSKMSCQHLNKKISQGRGFKGGLSLRSYSEVGTGTEM